jgi:curved DNA-binding protein CbpA
MSDPIFWRELGLEPGADRKQIKRAYWQLARQNHPDFFPEERKAIQELKMIALNEAYAYLMGTLRAEGGLRFDTSWGGSGVTGVAEPVSKRTDLGFHKDPSYAYYKQGFIHFSRAIHGIEALYQSLSQRRVVHFKPRDDAYQRFAEGLVELRRAHEYFSRVVHEFDGSIWKHDARVKLRRIERFSALYRRILGNLTSAD